MLTDQAGQLWRLVTALEGAAVVLVVYRGDWCPYCNVQLAVMARSYDEYLRRGAAIAEFCSGGSITTAAMVAKLLLPFPILSDPGGAGAIRPWGVWDAKDAMSKPAIVVLLSDGWEVFHTVGVEFSGPTLPTERRTGTEGAAGVMGWLAEAPGRANRWASLPGWMWQTVWRLGRRSV